MNSENCVIFKGNRDGIAVLLDEETDFEDIKAHLKKKVVDASDFFDGAKTPIIFKGKQLSDDEELELIKIIRDNSRIDITFVKNEKTQLKFDKLRQIDIDFMSTVKIHSGSVRSGQCIEYKGNIIVLGDVNPGGEVVAAGNIVVLGRLRGVVHAGCSGDEGAFVAAFTMHPTQLRIAGLIIYLPKDIIAKIGTEPQFAFVNEGSITLSTLIEK